MIEKSSILETVKSLAVNTVGGVVTITKTEILSVIAYSMVKGFTDTKRKKSTLSVRWERNATLTMSDREKLIKLCKTLLNSWAVSPESAADLFISNGVTVQKWIPVSERLPDLVPCNAGTAYSEAVNVLTSGRKVLTAIWDGTDFIADAEFWEAEGEEITHWTPVLLPLPEPPKECE